MSIWYGVDPLAVYNPVMETQFYGDGNIIMEYIFWEIKILIFILTKILLCM
nr:hypothetical protein [Chryseobacterium gleum]